MRANYIVTKQMVSREILPGFVVHVSEDVQAETVEALQEMGRALMDMTKVPGSFQPGDVEQLARVVNAAERHYESSRQPIVVYWDQTIKQYQAGYQSLYKLEENVVVVRIPK